MKHYPIVYITLIATFTIYTTANAANTVDDGTPGIQFRGENGETIENLFSIWCETENWGPVFGKLTEDGDAFCSHDSVEFECDDFDLVEGRVIENDGEIPEECKEAGKAQKDGNVYYPVLVWSRHGIIPGKAVNAEVAYFGFEGKQFSRRKFKWFC